MQDLVIVDGHNFIFNYLKSKKVDSKNLSYLIERLIRDLVAYKHYKLCDLIVVFDAKSDDRLDRKTERIDDIEIIYSGNDESADTIIEELVYSRRGYGRVFVVTSDYMQQKVVFGGNIYRKSIREFGIEIKNCKREITKKINSISAYHKKSFYMLENRLGIKARRKFSDFIRNSVKNKIKTKKS